MHFYQHVFIMKSLLLCTKADFKYLPTKASAKVRKGMYVICVFSVKTSPISELPETCDLNVSWCVSECLIRFPELMVWFLLAQERSKQKVARHSICWMKDRNAKKEITFSSSRQDLQNKTKQTIKHTKNPNNNKTKTTTPPKPKIYSTFALSFCFYLCSHDWASLFFQVPTLLVHDICWLLHWWFSGSRDAKSLCIGKCFALSFPLDHFVSYKHSFVVCFVVVFFITFFFLEFFSPFLLTVINLKYV